MHSEKTRCQWAEPFHIWAFELADFKQAFEVWRLIQGGSATALKRFLELDKSSAARYLSGPASMNPKLTGDVLALARIGLMFQVSSKLAPGTIEQLEPCPVPGCKFIRRARLTPCVLYQLQIAPDGSLCSKLVPSRLVAAIWLQFSQLLIGERTIRRCEICKRLMDISETERKKSKRMHARCSKSARMRRYRNKSGGEEV